MSLQVLSLYYQPTLVGTLHWSTLTLGHVGRRDVLVVRRVLLTGRTGKGCIVRIANRQYQRVFQRVIELKFYSRASISNDKRVEKEIEIWREAVQSCSLMKQGSSFACVEGNPNSNCGGCIREKSPYNRSMGDFVNNFTIKLLLISNVDSLH